MELDVLRFFAKAYVAETESLVAEEKAIMYEFLDDADAHEILALLHTGDIPAPLTEQEMVYLEFNVGHEINAVFENAGMDLPFPVIYECTPADLLEFYIAENNLYEELLSEASVKGKMKEKAVLARSGLKDVAGRVGAKWQRMRQKYTPRNIKAGAKAKYGTRKAQFGRGVKALKGMPGKGKERWDKMGKMGKAGVIIGATAAAAAAIAAAYAVYKNYMSKAARACKGAENKEACKAKFRQQAVKAQIQTLQSQKARCKQTKNPEKCASKIDAKINKLKTKVA
jgi:cell pole-organizing protein PopZ